MKMKTMILALVASTAMTGAAIAGGGGGGSWGGGSVNILAPGSFVAGDMSNSNEMTGVGVIVNQQALLGNVNLEELEMENEDSPIEIDSLDAILGAAGYVGGDVKQTGIFFVDGDIEEELNIVGGDNGDYAFGDNETIGGDYLSALSQKVDGGGDLLNPFSQKNDGGGDLLNPLSFKGNDFSEDNDQTTSNTNAVACDSGDGGGATAGDGTGGDGTGGDATGGDGGTGVASAGGNATGASGTGASGTGGPATGAAGGATSCTVSN